MTDLQVKYQTLQLEKEKLAEDKRVHDSQIKQYESTASKNLAELPVLDAQVKKYLAEAGLTEKELMWYDSKAAADIANKYQTGLGSILRGIGSIIPG